MMAVLTARNGRIHLCVTVFAKCDSALCRSFGHLGGNLDSSSSSEALICFVKLVNLACSEFFLILHGIWHLWNLSIRHEFNCIFKELSPLSLSQILNIILALCHLHGFKNVSLISVKTLFVFWFFGFCLFPFLDREECVCDLLFISTFLPLHAFLVEG